VCCCSREVVDLQGSSYDLATLYDVFGSLIRDRDFANNNFLHQKDALAVISLAKTCTMYERTETSNFLAAGVCYNNIANLQLKNGRFQLAYENFERALEMEKKFRNKFKNSTDF
jgi:tetratricopeptide (TPR) repeat protein